MMLIDKEKFLTKRRSPIPDSTVSDAVAAARAAFGTAIPTKLHFGAFQGDFNTPVGVSEDLEWLLRMTGKYNENHHGEISVRPLKHYEVAMATLSTRIMITTYEELLRNIRKEPLVTPDKWELWKTNGEHVATGSHKFITDYARTLTNIKSPTADYGYFIREYPK